MNKLFNLLPLIIFCFVLALLIASIIGVQFESKYNTFTDQLFDFQLEAIDGYDNFDANTFKKVQKISLINIFASWCNNCLAEHQVLMKMKGYVDIYGIDWREKKVKDGQRWLRKYGNPYKKVGADPKSKAIISLGVSGAPETIVIGKKGNIRFRYKGVITFSAWQEILKPIIDQLRAE